MRRRRIGFAVGLVVAALAVSGCGGDDDAATPDPTEPAVEAGSTLTASVGPGFDISLTGPDGTDAGTLSSGSYTIEVDDQSDIHNFHLTGPGVEETTDVSGTGTDTWDVTVEPGTYSFVCDPHAGSMSGSFEVSG